MVVLYSALSRVAVGMVNWWNVLILRYQMSMHSSWTFDLQTVWIETTDKDRAKRRSNQMLINKLQNKHIELLSDSNYVTKYASFLDDTCDYIYYLVTYSNDSFTEKCNRLINFVAIKI